MAEAQDNKKRQVVMYPLFTDMQSLAEQYHRLKWYIPESSPYEVYLFHHPSLAVAGERLNEQVPPFLAELAGSGSNLHLVEWSLARFARVAAGSAAMGVWRVPARLRAHARRLDKLSVLMGRRWMVVDPTAKGTFEYGRYASFLFDHMRPGEKRAMRHRSKRILRNASTELRHLRKAYVFGTGPSLAQATDFDYSDGLRIVCNSIVRNPELLRHIKPHFIAAFDFVFHYGPSRYAAEFRRDLVNALTMTGAYFVVAEQVAPLMLRHYPELEERTIAVPITNQYDLRPSNRKVNVQLLDKFQVRTLDSVLTMLMLPLASTLADEVCVLGCDGRKASDKAFWSHHSASQYSDLMRTVNEAHPGFFDLSYVDYYDGYCRNVEAVIAAGEALGKSYKSLVPSFVPALARRALPSRAQS